MKALKANKQVAELINSHGYKTTIKDNIIIPKFEDNVKIETWVYPTQKEYGIQTRLDVGVSFNDGEMLYEAFGDMGSDIDDAINKNLENFSRSSLHVILEAFNSKNDYIESEQWNIDGVKYTAFIGDYNMKSHQGKEIIIPEKLFDAIEYCISNHTFEDELYFVRFFYAHHENKAMATEFMINNIRLKEEEEILENLDWMQSEGYYSVRNFLILKKV